MSKILNLDKSVYDICTVYPEVADIMKELGFESIAAPGMLRTAGRFMTIPKGAQMKKISLKNIEQIFREKGFEVIGGNL